MTTPTNAAVRRSYRATSTTASSAPTGRRRHRSPLLAGLVVAVLAVALWGCGSSGSSPSSSSVKPGGVNPPVSSGGATGTSTPGSFYGQPTTITGTTATVKVIDNDFTPKNLVIKAGTKVTFDATGHNQHDIVPDDPKLFDFTVPAAKLPPGGQVTFTFDKPGTYYYYCSLHATATAGSMRGVITVKP